MTQQVHVSQFGPFKPTPRQALREVVAALRVDKTVGLPVPPVSAATATAQPVLLVPGFLAGDSSLAPLARHLRRRGHPTFPSGIRFNARCSEATIDHLEWTLQAAAAGAGRPLAIIGQSRGGSLGKLLALRRPDLVAGLITLGSPVLGQLAVAPAVLNQVELLVRLNEAGLRKLMSRDCVHGACASRVQTRIRQPLPRDIRYTAVYSRSDGIVDWRACLDPGADHVEITGSHSGMGTDSAVWAIVAHRVATPNPRT